MSRRATDTLAPSDALKVKFGACAADTQSVEPLLAHTAWLEGAVPNEVRDQIRRLVEVVSHLPDTQPLGVITADGVVLGANEPLLRLLRAQADDLLETVWDDLMPTWQTHVRGVRGGESARTRTFDEYVCCCDGERLRVHVVASPVFSEAGDGSALAAWALFLNPPAVREERGAAHGRRELEGMVSGVAARFVDCSSETSAEAFAYALREIGRATGVDLCSMHELAGDRSTVDWARQWKRVDDEVTPSGGITTLVSFPWLHERLREGRLLEVGDVGLLPSAAAAECRLWSGQGMRSLLVTPLMHAGLLIGFLTIGAQRRNDPWPEEDESLLSLVADLITKLLLDRWDEDNLKTLSTCFLSFGADVVRNIDAICAAAGSVLGASFVMYERRAGADLDVVAGWHLPDELPRRLSGAGSPGLDVIIGGGDDACIIERLDESAYVLTSPLVTRHGARTFIAFPVSAADHPAGALCAVFDIDARLRPSQLDVFRVLGRATSVEEERRVGMEESLLSLSLLEQAMERTVATLSAAVSIRDPYTAGHERRVASIAGALAVKLGIEGEQLRLLRVAATVHDLGKILVPAELLSKPSRLSEAEFAIVKMHSTAGAELLKPAELPDVISEAVLQHHERLDGSGYPAGLSGDEIGEFGRVLAVADVVEAMSSHRPYRPGLGIDAALEEIELGRGARYDACVCDACLTLFREDGFVIPE